MCRGSGSIDLLGVECQFCNGTGEPSAAATSFLETHTCQCSMLDRVTCPVCRRDCHHDTPNRPKLVASPA